MELATPILKIALTGGIASGKSLIRGFIEMEGVPTIDADDVVHGLLANDTDLKQKIREHFGAKVFFEDGAVNRKALGDVIFVEVSERKLLESWIHPKTRIEIADFFEVQQKAGQTMAVAIIPLLFESGLAELYDIVWLVKADEHQQCERLMNYRSLSRLDAERRIQNQLTFQQKQEHLAACPKAVVIDNTGSIETTAAQVKELIASVRQA